MNELSKSIEVHLGKQGRLVIPATLRRSPVLRQGCSDRSPGRGAAGAGEGRNDQVAVEGSVLASAERQKFGR